MGWGTLKCRHVCGEFGATRSLYVSIRMNSLLRMGKEHFSDPSSMQTDLNRRSQT